MEGGALVLHLFTALLHNKYLLLMSQQVMDGEQEEQSSKAGGVMDRWCEKYDRSFVDGS